MNLPDFFNYVEAHPDLEGMGIGKDGMLSVRHLESKMTTAIEYDAMKDLTWDVMLDIFTGKRDPEVIYHMTRVCGYYSRPQNWNKGKIGELADRQKGTYEVPA